MQVYQGQDEVKILHDGSQGFVTYEGEFSMPRHWIKKVYCDTVEIENTLDPIFLSSCISQSKMTHTRNGLRTFVHVLLYCDTPVVIINFDKVN